MTSMLRISGLIVAVLVLKGMVVLTVSSAQAQTAPTRGGWTMEKCMAVQ
jgi:hypothetical protein